MKAVSGTLQKGFCWSWVAEGSVTWGLDGSAGAWLSLLAGSCRGSVRSLIATLRLDAEVFALAELPQDPALDGSPRGVVSRPEVGVPVP